MFFGPPRLLLLLLRGERSVLLPLCLCLRARVFRLPRRHLLRLFLITPAATATTISPAHLAHELCFVRSNAARHFLVRGCLSCILSFLCRSFLGFLNGLQNDDKKQKQGDRCPAKIKKLKTAIEKQMNQFTICILRLRFSTSEAAMPTIPVCLREGKRQHR